MNIQRSIGDESQTGLAVQHVMAVPEVGAPRNNPLSMIWRTPQPAGDDYRRLRAGLAR